MVYVFGYSVCYVLTGSMEPSISKGDMILIKKVSDVSTIKKGDIITFKRTQGVLAGQNVTHRVESVEKNGNQYYFFTKGDANSAPDSQIVLQQEILGVYQKKASVLKFVVEGLSNPYIFIVVVITPLLIMFALQIVNLVVLSNKNQDK
jgi:signal peptidase